MQTARRPGFIVFALLALVLTVSCADRALEGGIPAAEGPGGVAAVATGESSGPAGPSYSTGTQAGDAASGGYLSGDASPGHSNEPGPARETEAPPLVTVPPSQADTTGDAPDAAPGDTPGDTPETAQPDTPEGSREGTQHNTTESSAPSGEPYPSGEPSPSGTPSPSGDGTVILTICGDGVAHETAWTLEQLQSMREGYREYTYSTTNNWPTFGYAAAHGISLPYLLEKAEVTDNWRSIKLIAADGYFAVVTLEQIMGIRYAYAEHTREGSSGVSRVEPVLAWEWGEDGGVREENLRFFIGQSGPMEVNTSALVRDIDRIEVMTRNPGVWAAPEASIADGSAVEFGTELRLLHDDMDSIRIYYTLDGSEPGFDSLVYNRSASYFQPHLIAPVFLAESVTIKAFAAGVGKDPSPVATFNYTVSEEPW